MSNTVYVRRSTRRILPVLKTSVTATAKSPKSTKNDDTVNTKTTIGNTQERNNATAFLVSPDSVMPLPRIQKDEGVTVPDSVPSLSLSSSTLPSNGKKRKRCIVKAEAAGDNNYAMKMVKKKSAVSTSLSSTKGDRPTSEECEFAVRELSKLHPDVIEKCNEIRKSSTITTNVANDCKIDKDIISNSVGGVNVKKEDEGKLQASSCGLQPTILDGVVSTILSQNTTSANSTRAFSNLKKAFPDWNIVASLTTPIKIETAIHCGGLAKKKAENILNMCQILRQERGEVSLEYLRTKSNNEIKKDLLRFKGLGSKTVSCVLLFTLGRNEFPVDTHVYRISKQHKWIPSNYSRDDGYEYLNEIIPNHLKLDLHCLMVQHGRECHRCAARGKPQFPPKDGSKLNCPLIHLLTMATATKSSTVSIKMEKSN
jgi:endonuclease-3